MNTPTRRTRRHRPARCPDCHQPTVWLASPWSGRWRRFDPTPLNGRAHNGPTAYPVEGRRAWRVRDLVEELMIRRDCSRAEAEDEAYDMPFHVPHVCPPRHHAAVDPQEVAR